MKTLIVDQPDELTDGADAKVIVCSDDGSTTLAQCSLWWSSTPRKETGLIGHFQPGDHGVALLEAAEGRLRQAGCNSAIGPMDGSTWRSYRLVTDSDGREPFFLEPQNPPDWPGLFADAGWGDLATYTSSEIDLHSGAAQPALERVARRLASAGVTIRALRTDDYQEELRRIYEVSVVSFRENFLYTEISFEAFANMYSKVEKLLVPDWSLLAEDEAGKPVGFVFALPEPEDPGTIIVKTLAVLPQRHLGGLGSLLIDRVHQAALASGCQTAIHALQHHNNSSLKISSRHSAKVFRVYTLFEKSFD